MQKQKIRKIGLDEAARVHKWSSLHKQRVKTLLQCDYMSSESSADESGDEAIKSSILRVKKIVWLKKKYRDAFHQIDITYYNAHKKSRDKQRVQGDNSTRLQPQGGPEFAVKKEYRNAEAESLNDSITSVESSLSEAVTPELEDC